MKEIFVDGDTIFYDGVPVAQMIIGDLNTTLRSEFIGLLESAAINGGDDDDECW